MQDERFLYDNQLPKLLLAVTAAAAIIYFIMIAFFFERGDSLLFGLLIIGEIFHLWQATTFIATIWETEDHAHAPRDPAFAPPVDVFITVCGEPLEVIEKTAHAAKTMRYPNFNVFILNDGFVAKKDNWREVELLAERLGVNCITRRVPGGAKAGNINNGLTLTWNPFVVIFDADHVPAPEFLESTMPYFCDPQLAFVQTPQFYENQSANFLAQGAWEQQVLFFGPICKGKNHANAVPMCGTNMVIRREALDEVGGMYEGSIAEDFITGFLLHRNRWRSLYLPQILARGLAPLDFGSYFKQQFRWARGSLDLLFRHNLLFVKGPNGKQRLQYLSSVSYFLSGWVVLIDALIPLIFFFTGLFPILTSTMALALIFIPYMLLMLYTLQRSSNFSFSYRALAFSMSGFPVLILSSLASVVGKRSGFSVTSKQGGAANFASLTIPQIIYPVVAGIGAVYYLMVYGAATPAWVANVAWGILNSVVFAEYVKAALPSGQRIAAPAIAAEAESAPGTATAAAEAYAAAESSGFATQFPFANEAFDEQP